MGGGTGLKEDIDRFRGMMTMEIVINSILLAMGYVGFYSLPLSCNYT